MRGTQTLTRPAAKGAGLQDHTDAIDELDPVNGEAVGAGPARLNVDGDAGAWAARAAGEYQRLGASWWRDRLPAGAGPRSGSWPTAAREVHLRPGEGGIWWAGFQGSVTAIRDVKGLHYLRVLLQHPGADIPAIGLSDTVAGHPGRQAAGGGLGAVLDRQALSAYRRRLADLDADLGEARAWADVGRAAKLAAERDALLGQLRAATGLGGRVRQPGSAGERARIAVRKAIASAIERVSAADPALGRILSATVTTGTICRYDPDPDRPVRWILSERGPAAAAQADHRTGQAEPEGARNRPSG